MAVFSKMGSSPAEEKDLHVVIEVCSEGAHRFAVL